MSANVAPIITTFFTTSKLSYYGAISTTILVADDATAGSALDTADRKAYRPAFTTTYFAAGEKTIISTISRIAVEFSFSTTDPPTGISSISPAERESNLSTCTLTISSASAETKRNAITVTN